MATHVIIDTRNKKVMASTDAPGEGTAFFAVDLINDTWQDYLYFVNQASSYEKDGQFAYRNRYLRAALVNLFAHLDGVVRSIYGPLVINNLIAVHAEEDEWTKCGLKTMMFRIRDYLVDGQHQRLPYINLDLKPIRDIINHPSIDKSSGPPHDYTVMNHIDVYGIPIEDVVVAGQQIGRWLDAVCSYMGYERFVDTKEALKQFQTALGIGISEAQEF